MKRRRAAPLARFALAAARGDLAAVTRCIDPRRRAGWPRAAFEEVALMLTLYAGYPSAIESLRTLDERWPARPPSAGEVPEDERARRGLATLARIYGTARPALLRGLARLHPALASWVVDHGYGRVLARERLDLRTRELITVALLAAGGWERQLASHVLGATRAGATPAEVRAMVREGRAAARRPALVREEAVFRLARARAADARR
jgi:alkylhydroperoxidase/carboxymuconolactone decarboxylase family protein YurZ